jgi:hypothetical protein
MDPLKLNIFLQHVSCHRSCTICEACVHWQCRVCISTGSIMYLISLVESLNADLQFVRRPCDMWRSSWLKILIVLLLKCYVLSVLLNNVDCPAFSPLHLFLRMTVLGLTYYHACNVFLRKLCSLGFCVYWLHFNVVYSTLNELHGDCHITDTIYFDCLHLCLYMLSLWFCLGLFHFMKFQ